MKKTLTLIPILFLIFITIWLLIVNPGTQIIRVMKSKLYGAQQDLMLLPVPARLWALVKLLDKSNRRKFTSSLFTSAIIESLVCGWFYFSLYIRHGSIFAFNSSPQTLSANDNHLDDIAFTTQFV